jgi:hypothetical protein
MTASIHETIDRNPASSPLRSTTPVPDKGEKVTDLDTVRTDRLTSAQQRRAAAHTRDLTALLRERPDLAGVHAPADFTVDSVRWCV